MRRARNVEIGRYNGDIFGICLTGNFCAEHEWGIERIAQAFGLEPNEIGIEKRRVRQIPLNFFYYVVGNKGSTETVLALTSRLQAAEMPKNKRSRDKFFREFGRGDLMFYDFSDENTAGAWSSDDFGIRTRDAELMDWLSRFYTAVENGDAAIWLGAGAGFQRGGLCLGIISRMDPEFVQEMYDVDVDHNKLLEADNLTGIRKFLKRAGEEQKAPSRSLGKKFDYYALRAAWADSIKSTKDGKIQTDYDVIYFLNPCHQNHNNFGWFTVEQLMEWTEGRGPIPKDKN